jgi:autotransporter translocation and assembly factor TamB
MRARRLLLISAAALLIAFLLAVCFAPLIVAGGLRVWAQRAAHREGLHLELGEIRAPFLRPVVIRNLRLRSEPGQPFQIDCTAPRVELGLNLSGIFSGSKRPLRDLQVDGLTLVIHRDAAATATTGHAPWSILENLLADRFKLSGVNLRAENGLTTVDVRDGTLTGSELESGALTAREITISAPWFQKTFSNLRGATSWQENRLSLGALSLIRGLDIDTISIDLSQIGNSRLGMEVSIDAFGGKIRGRISSDDRDGKRIWDVAGNGSGISFAQMSDALEWNNRASGSLHASKFTFRGEMNDLRHATASLWAELSGLTWRDRTADTVMIGASLYNREVQVEQLYIKQRNNELTLTGEFGWPDKLTDEFKPAFRGDLSASINDLGEFARLFGWSPPDFAGQLSASGSVNAHEGKLGGQVSITGNSLVLFRSPIESLEIKLELEESRVAVTQFELRQTGDFFHGEGSFALTGDHSYAGAFQTSVAEIANYRGFIPQQFLPFPLEGSVSAEWKGRGTNNSGSGTFQARGRKVRVADGPLLPFEAELQADYSPQTIFFRQLHFWNEHAELSAFVNVTKDYFQVQELELKLNTHPRLQGNFFVPLSVRKLRETSSWLAALSPDPFFDIDLTLDALDLAELAAAVKTRNDLAGQANGQLQLSGTPASLQGKTEFHLRDFVVDNSPALTIDLDASLALGMASAKANAVVRASDPVKFEGSVPLQLAKRDADYVLAANGPLSATVSFPAIFLAKLPSYLSRGIFTRGILSGNLNLSDSVQTPLVTGSVNLVDGQLLRGPSLSAAMTFKGRDAVIDFAHVKEHNADISARGEINFQNLSELRLRVLPNVSLSEPVGLSAGDCVSSVAFYISPAALLSGSVPQINLTGNFSGAGWTISLSHERSADQDEADRTASPQTFRLCRDGKTLSLGLAPALLP